MTFYDSLINESENYAGKSTILQTWLLFAVALFLSFFQYGRVWESFVEEPQGLRGLSTPQLLFCSSSSSVKVILISLFRVCHLRVYCQISAPQARRHGHATRLLKPWFLSPEQVCCDTYLLRLIGGVNELAGWGSARCLAIVAVLPKSIVIVDHTIYDLILFC